MPEHYQKSNVKLFIFTNFCDFSQSLFISQNVAVCFLQKIQLIVSPELIKVSQMQNNFPIRSVLNEKKNVSDF